MMLTKPIYVLGRIGKSSYILEVDMPPLDMPVLTAQQNLS